MKKHPSLQFVRYGLVSLFFILCSLVFCNAQDPILRTATEMHTVSMKIDADASGRFILSASQDKTAKIWDAATGELIRTIRPPIGLDKIGMLYAGAISPEADYVALAGWTPDTTEEEYCIYIYDVNAGEITQRLGGLDNTVFDLEISPNGYYLAASFPYYAGVEIFKKVPGKSIFEPYKLLDGYKGHVNRVAFSSDGRFATCSFDGKIRIYDFEFNLLNSAKGSGKQAFSLAFSPDGGSLAVGYYDAVRVDVFSTSDMKLDYQLNTEGLTDYGASTNSLVYSANGRYLYGAGYYSRIERTKDEYLIRRWESGAGGAYIDIPVGSAGISEMEVLGEEKIAWSSLNGEMRVISENGNTVYHNTSGIKDVITEEEGFHTGPMLSEISYTLEDLSKVSFNIEKRTLEISEPTPTELGYDSVLFLANKLFLEDRYDELEEHLENTVHIEGDYNSAELAFLYGIVYLLKGEDLAIEYLLDGIWLSDDYDKIRRFRLFEEQLMAIAYVMKMGAPKKLAKKAIDLIENYYLELAYEYNMLMACWDGEVPHFGYSAHLSLLEHESCLCFALDQDTSYVGTNWYLYSFSEDDEVKWKTPLESEAWNIRTDDESNFLVTQHSGGVTNWFFKESGNHAFTLFIEPGTQKWIIYTPEGYFDAVPGAADLIGWHVNRGIDKTAAFYPLEQFYDKYYIPNLGHRILTGSFTPGANDDTRDFHPPPLVEILSPKLAQNTEEELATGPMKSAEKKLRVEVKITDNGGGVDEVRLYQNDKLIESKYLGIEGGKQDNDTSMVRFGVDLTNGMNSITVRAFNNQRTEAVPALLDINYEGMVKKPDLYMLVISLDQYENPAYNLNYANADASAFKYILENKSSEIFEQVHSFWLRDGEALKKNIMDTFRQITEAATPEDVFVFYYAGHGVMSEELKAKFYLIPHDITQIYGNQDVLPGQGVSAEELQDLSKNLKALKQLYVLDACQSGGITDYLSVRGAAKEKALAQLARSTGTYWLVASETEQFAMELSELNHGLFTYSILKGLKGNADGGKQDGKITVKELSAFLNDIVPELSIKYTGEPQYPNSFGFGQDFPLVIDE